MDEAGLGICLVRDFRRGGGKISRANQQFQLLSGRDSTQLNDLPITDLLPPGELPRIISYYRKYQRFSQTPQPYETMLLRMAKDNLPVEIRPCRSGFLRPGHFLVLVRDISRRRQHERTIREQNRKLQMLNNLTRVLHHVRDLRQAIDASLETASDLSGMGIAGIYLRRSGRLRLVKASGPMGALPRFLPGRRSLGLENDKIVLCPAPSRDGEPGKPGPISFKCQGVYLYLLLPLITEQDEFIGLLILATTRKTQISSETVEMLTGMKQQMTSAFQNALLIEKLAESEEKYKTILNNASDGFVLFKGQKVLEMNPAFERIMSQHTDNQYLLEPSVFTRDENSAVFEEPVGHWEKTMLTDDNRQRWINISKSSLKIPGNQVAYFIRDITERKELESFRILSERTAATERIAAVVAHEITNPLQAMMINLGILSNTAIIDDFQQELLNGLETGLKNIRETVETLRELQLPERIRMRPLGINNVLKKTLNLARGRLEQSGTTLRTSFASNLPRIRGAATYLQQAFLNFVLNACEAMPDGGTLYVTTYLHREAIFVRFKDTGVGIPQGKIHQIFDFYYTTKPEAKSSGLGLTIALNLLRRHNGEVYVKSKPGQGANFTVRLPV